MLHNLHAYTESGQDYPAYVSINRDDAGKLTITVRSRGDAGRNVGVIAVSPEHLEALACDLLDALGKPAPALPDPRAHVLRDDGKTLRERIKSADND